MSRMDTDRSNYSLIRVIRVIRGCPISNTTLNELHHHDTTPLRNFLSEILHSATFVTPEDQSMKRLLSSAAIVLALAFQTGIAQQPAPQSAGRGGGQGRGASQPPVQAKPEELAKINDKTEQNAALVKDLK